MPEPPDFDQKALNIIDAISVCASPSLVRPDVQTKALAQIVIAEQLRLVWNARGAADLATIDTELSILMGSQMAGPYVKNLDRALRSLDR